MLFEGAVGAGVPVTIIANAHVDEVAEFNRCISTLFIFNIMLQTEGAVS